MPPIMGAWPAAWCAVVHLPAERPMTKCPAGTYCPAGTASSVGTPCPAGTWSDKTGLTSPSECQPVKAGAFSYEGETSAEGSGKCAKVRYPYKTAHATGLSRSRSHSVLELDTSP